MGAYEPPKAMQGHAAGFAKNLPFSAAHKTSIFPENLANCPSEHL
jgi:hypothetical protein